MAAMNAKALELVKVPAVGLREVRWGCELAGLSDTYTRSYRALLNRLVQLFVNKARCSGGYAELGEEDAILDMRRLFEKRGLTR